MAISPDISVFRPGAQGRAVVSPLRTPIGPVRAQQLAMADKLREAGKKPPLDFLLDVMSDETLELKERVDAAKAALPYVHRKLPQMIDVEVKSPVSFERVDLFKISQLGDEELDRALELAAKLAVIGASSTGEGEAQETEAVEVLPGHGATSP